MIPIHYVGWTIILLAVLRILNKAALNIRWKFAFSMFTMLYSLGKLAVLYTTPEVADVLYLFSAATIILPFLRFDYNLYGNVERISEASLLLSIGIIVLLS